MTPGDVIGPILAVVAALGTGWLTKQSVIKQAKASAEAAVQVKTVEVDAAAYERARAMYESGIRQLEEQIGRLSTQVNEERDASNLLRNQVRALEDLVAQLRRQLIQSGIDVAIEQLDARRTR